MVETSRGSDGVRWETDRHRGDREPVHHERCTHAGQAHLSLVALASRPLVPHLAAAQR